MEKEKKFMMWLAVFLYALVIFLFSSLPPKFVPQLFIGSDKVFHFVEYLPFGFLVSRASSKSLAFSLFNTFIFPVILVALYAFSDEIHQLFVPGRDFSFVDISFDVIGAGAGNYLFFRWQK